MQRFDSEKLAILDDFVWDPPHFMRILEFGFFV